jgi:hypothetical protein
MEFIECNVPITMNVDSLNYFVDFGEWLLLKVIYGEQRVEYGVLHNVETAKKAKMSLFDGNFLYDYAGAITVIGYKVIE